MTVIRMFDDDDLVDVTIRGARIGIQGDHHVSLFLDAVDDPIVVPVNDDNGEPLAAVSISDAVPQVRKGQLWRSVQYGFLFFATQPIVVSDNVPVDGDVQMIMPNNEALSVAEVVAIWGRLELVAEEAYPPPDDDLAADAGPAPDAIRIPAADVRLGDRLHTHLDRWHLVEALDQPANEGPALTRLYTDLEPRGLLFRYDDEVWVRRSGAQDHPLYDAVAGFDLVDAKGSVQFDWLAPGDEPQPGDKDVTKASEVVPPAPEAVAADKAATQLLPKVTDEEPAR